ncbi:probable ATP-dependent RNA helicase DDX31 isoform X2 [Bufo gargarizans]|uniref:probable ATP-dependent RNA helicase DDX31 isoform X2 n=1 Tax=Bufo gargarizans TaxID=30331 RepID=UPI001CF58CB8|nr:probable ATP-dependent RNA helicase DDX31 isoform X2 [Bufo gargarizans]
MGDQGLILNISEAPVKENKKFQKSQQPRGKWNRKALKRKSQQSGEAPPSKRPAPPAKGPTPPSKQAAPPAKRPVPPSKRPAPPAKGPTPPSKRPAPSAKRPVPPSKRPAPPAKRPAPPASSEIHGNNKSCKNPKADPSPKKGPAGRNEERPKGRPAVKTSSLFKNNPELPDIERSEVKQVQEKVFSSDSFSELGLHPHLVATLTKVLEMSRMTSVQKMTIPALLSGRDALVRSQTGSGKTLAYGVPLVQGLQGVASKIQRSDGPYALILVPTRELALQSFTTIQKLLKPFTWIVPGVLMGGEKRKSEKARLRKGINILISTPGRLVDHIKSTKSIHFTHLRWLIVDEADRILDLGFEKDLTTILNALNSQSERRQNVLLSATLTQGVTRLADISLQNPITVTVAEDSGNGSRSEQEATDTSGFAMPEKLHQHTVVVPSKLKLVTLSAFILGKWKSDPKPKMIVFFPSCELVEFHHMLLRHVLPLPSPSKDQAVFLRLHGNMEQKERTEVFQQFTVARAGILLCTDVAARGLDLPQVTWIVQYNAPASAAEYIHRVGRTARLCARGSSLLILIPSEAEYIQTLVNHKISVSEMKMEEILSNLLQEDFLIIKRGKRAETPEPQAVRERATVLQTKFEDYIHASAEASLSAKNALQSYIRSYATYPKNLKHVFHIRSLHLGHVAKSFGLRDAPQNLSHQLAGNSKKQKAMKPKKTVRTKQRFSDLLKSEFSSGLPPRPKKMKTPQSDEMKP